MRGLRHEYVQHSAAVVEQHPLRGLIALGVVDHDVVVILEMPLYVVCQRLDLRGRGRGADDEIFGQLGQALNVQDLDALRFFSISASQIAFTVSCASNS